MFPPHDLSHDDRELVQYLLRQLPPADTERLDEASIVDDEVAARLRTIEDDLVDAYVRGSLKDETLAHFESHFLSSPHRRQQVARARRFVRAVDREAASRAPTPAAEPAAVAAMPARMPLRLAIPKRPWVLWSVAASIAVLLIGSSALLVQTLRLNRGLRVAENARAELDQRARDLERQVGELRASTAQAVKPSERVPQPAAGQSREAPAIALVLMPQVRAIGDVPTVAIPAGADRLAIELRLESNDFPRYQVGLRDPAVNEIVWRSAWTAPKASGDQASILVSVPADTLKPQHYSLDLSARGPDGGVEVVGSYAFEVVPR